MIEVKNISKSYGRDSNKVNILNDISFSVTKTAKKG